MGWGSRVGQQHPELVYPALALEEYHFCLVTRTVESGSGRMWTFGLGSGLSLWSDSPGNSLQNPGRIILGELDTLLLGIVSIKQVRSLDPTAPGWSSLLSIL